MRKLLAKSIFSFVSSVFTGSSAASLSYITPRLISPFSRSEGHPVSSSVVRRASAALLQNNRSRRAKRQEGRQPDREMLEMLGDRRGLDRRQPSKSQIVVSDIIVRREYPSRCFSSRENLLPTLWKRQVFDQVRVCVSLIVRLERCIERDNSETLSNVV